MLLKVTWFYHYLTLYDKSFDEISYLPFIYPYFCTFCVRLGLLSDAAFFYIADNLGHEWEKMAINLNLRISELERIKREGSSDSLPNKVYKSLISWRRRTELDNRGKIEELFSALSDAGRQDVVDELKNKYKFS